ncbi:MAG TPA: SDR family oxidoreductase [Chthoniobacterales bacterium]|jgi:NAD(P)-dependent dehydrogenase (short-subunit alcohol dehydrogenase family)|nr:SDR family oxidoreductase [Chthoniobacterales bacterium]
MSKRILVTGASRGIGRAIAEKLAAADVTLLLHGRNTVALAETCKAVQDRGASVVKLIHDLATEKGVANLISQVGSEPLNVLVNNAGIGVVKPFREITFEEWKQTIGVNVTAPFLLMQRFAGQMPPGSSIVNILSVAAKTAFANWSAYCMSKFALEGFSQSVREELRERRIRVINIYPAATNTGIWDAVAGDWPREKMISPGQVADAVAFAISQPSDVLVENVTLRKLTGNL